VVGLGFETEMPCYHPTDVMVQRKTLYGKKKYTGTLMTVPCGNCIGCRAEQGRQWAVRMMHEVRMHESSLFVTLTLADEFLNENVELCPKDFQGFIKGLRKTQERRISFFGCGEYGGITNRPHYHAVLFGIEFLDTVDCTDINGRDYRWSKTLEDSWGRGLCEVGSVTMASASYVAGYITKKQRAKEITRANPSTGVLLVPEFSRMSLRPAIGRNWIHKYWTDVYPRDYVVIDGVEAKPPRYYDKFMDLQDDKGGTKERRDVMEHVRQRRYDEAIEMTKYQLMSGEKIAKARADLFAKRITI